MTVTVVSARGVHIEQTPLSTVDGWSADHVKKMQDVWITTAQQVVALGATEGGIPALSRQLGISPERARELLDAASAALTPDERSELSRRSDTSNLGLGAFPPDQPHSD